MPKKQTPDKSEKTPAAAKSKKEQPAEKVSGDISWFLQALDQKLEALREHTLQISAQVQSLEQKQHEKGESFQNTLHQHKLDLQTLEQSLQYLSHKTQMQLKEAEVSNERFRHETESSVKETHFATKEELFNLSRRVEVLEKLIF